MPRIIKNTSQDKPEYNQKQTQSFIRKWMKNWNIKSQETFRLSTVRQKERVVGDIWREDGKWMIQKNGYIQSSARHPELFNESKAGVFYTCNRCKTKFLDNQKNVTQIDVIYNTGKCTKCHAEIEFDKMMEGKTRKPLEEIVQNFAVKDSFGNTLMSLEEIREEYGEEKYNYYKEKLFEFLKIDPDTYENE